MDYLKDFLSNFSQQLQIYNDGRLNKHKLDKLLVIFNTIQGQRDYDQRRVE